jgi:hypothetical protein
MERDEDRVEWKISCKKQYERIFKICSFTVRGLRRKIEKVKDSSGDFKRDYLIILLLTQKGETEL